MRTTSRSSKAGASIFLAASLLAGCGVSDSPERVGTHAAATAPAPIRPSAADAGDTAWVEQVVPALLGRPVRSFGELKFLAVATARHGRAVVAEALMRDPAFVDRWTGVLLDRMRVDREGYRNQEACFEAPSLPADHYQRAAARTVLHTRRTGNDAALSSAASEPSAPPWPPLFTPVGTPPLPAGATYNMADVVRGSLLIDNVFPAYRGLLFAINAQRTADAGETENTVSRQIGDHFNLVYLNKSMICMQCHRSQYTCTPTTTFLTPAYDWAEGHEGRIFPGLSRWETVMTADPPADDGDWTGSFAASPGSLVPFEGWSGTQCGQFGPDTSASATGLGLVLPARMSGSVWSLDDRLKEGYLALRESYDPPHTLDTGAGYANEGRTLGAYWLASAFANDVWRELFGAPLNIANHVSRNSHQHRMLWNLAEQHVIGRSWSLKGLLVHLVTSDYFNRAPPPSATREMPKVFEPFADEGATPPQTHDYVTDAIHRRSADQLFRMKAAALGWTGPSGAPQVTHFPGAATFPTRAQALAMGLHLSRLVPSNSTSSQHALLAWEASAGRCERPASVARDWIDALADRAWDAGGNVRSAAEALRFRLLGRGLSAGLDEVSGLAAFLGAGIGTPLTTAYANEDELEADLRDLCEVLVKTPQFMLAGVPHGLGASETDFTAPPDLLVGDMLPGGALADDTPEQACASWQVGFPFTLDCSSVEFPPVFDWSQICPGMRCVYIEQARYRIPFPWPCLTCDFTIDWHTLRPPPVDPRVPFTSIPMDPARAGTFLVWAETVTVQELSGFVQIVRASGKIEPVQVGSLLGIGDSLELAAGATFKALSADQTTFQSPSPGMPAAQDGGKWLFMVTGEAGLPAPAQLTPHAVDLATANATAEAMRRAARNEEPGSVSFVHTVTASSGNSSFIQHPALDGQPDRIVLVSPVAGATINDRRVGTWYSGGSQRWAVYNEDLAAMPVGAKFSVRVFAPGGEAFLHQVTAANTSGHVTYIDDARINGRADVAVQVSHIWNPPGAPGVYNDHPVGVWYDAGQQKWAIYNDDFAAMPAGASFAVKQGGYYTVTSSAATRVGNAVVLDDPNTNGVTDARLFITHNWQPPGGPAAYHVKRSALRYDQQIGKWTIVNLDGSIVADGVSFNVHRGY